MPFIGILTNLYQAISDLSSSGGQKGSGLSSAAESLSPDLSRLSDLLVKQAVARMEDEEVKGERDDESNGLHIDVFSQISEAMPLIDKQAQFDNLADLINRMSSFDPSLFKRLLEIVLNELRPAN